MNEERITLPVPSDSEGFVSFDCPLCGFRFKLNAQEVQEAPESQLYCPYCGIPSDQVSFISQDVIEAGVRRLEDLVRQRINAYANRLARSSRGSRAIEFKPGRPLPPVPEKPLVEDESLVAIEFPCCSKHVKTFQSKETAPVYCPYCGVNH